MSTLPVSMRAVAQDGIIGIVAAKPPYLVDPDMKSSQPRESV